MYQEQHILQGETPTTIPKKSVMITTADKNDIAKAFDKALDEITKHINEVSVSTPIGKQPQNNNLKISPADSDKSASSGHSSQSSGQTSSTSITEESIEIKVLGKFRNDGRPLPFNVHFKDPLSRLETVEENPEEGRTAPSSPIASSFDLIMPISLPQTHSVASRKSLMSNLIKPPTVKVVSTQGKAEHDYVIPKTSSRTSCIACIHGNVLLKPCGHRMCESCVHILRSNTVKSSFKTYSECILCKTPVAEFVTFSGKKESQGDNISPVKTNVNIQFMQNTVEEDTLRPLSWGFSGMTPLTTRPVQAMASVTNRPQQIQFGELSKLATAFNWPVIKLTNIPWDVSLKEIKTFLSAFKLPNASLYAQCIHIIMDRTSGKTLSEAYIELATSAEANRAVDTRNMKPLKGRLVSCMRSSQEDLMRAVFPKWKGEFSGCDAVVTSEILQSSPTVPQIPFITREEMNSLLVVCRNYKLHFSRKCAERPFENIISVLVKFPFHQGNLYTTLQRDLLFEMLKLAIESLKIHLSKEYHRIDETLLERMMRAGIMTPVFTERQKLMILQVSGMTLPADLQDRLTPFKKDETEQSSETHHQVNPTSNTNMSTDNITLIPSSLFHSPPVEFSEYKGIFDPFRDDRELRASFLQNELKLAQAQVRVASTSRLPPPQPSPAQPQLGAFRAFDVWNRLNEYRNMEFVSNQIQSLHTQQRNVLDRLHTDHGKNPFFVKDFNYEDF
ncbi:nucleotide-binding, alpha-beta plait [Gigaspora margarita]|uniref:Nucleotide-binding, alpha-beta plait n=1 Tax=Gigaspora margarita TaxID=4874 RepID=A0A8H4A7T8_GIGMA|nr:nucleotide-binding, alpha-beta plait [Gigaspora margarita]